MDAVWYAIADFFEFCFPLFRALGKFMVAFFGFAIAIMSFYWMWYLSKNPDKIRSNRVEDQPE